MIVTEREREAETQAEGEAGSMHREPDVGLDPGSPGSRPGPKAGAKPLRHPKIPFFFFLFCFFPFPPPPLFFFFNFFSKCLGVKGYARELSCLEIAKEISRQ